MSTTVATEVTGSTTKASSSTEEERSTTEPTSETETEERKTGKATFFFSNSPLYSTHRLKQKVNSDGI